MAIYEYVFRFRCVQQSNIFLLQIWIISQKRVRNTFMHRSTISGLHFSPNGQCLVACSFDMSVRVWRLRDGSSRVLSLTYGVYPWSVRCSLDGRYIASGCNPQNIMIWNMRTGKLVTKWRGHLDTVTSLVFTPDGKGLLSASRDRQVIHWNVTSLGSLGITDPLSSDIMGISCLLGHKVRSPHSSLRHGNQHSLECHSHCFYFTRWEVDCFWLV